MTGYIILLCTGMLKSESWVERVLAAETIARISQPATGWTEYTLDAVARGLLDCGHHVHWWVRRSALFCCGRLRLHDVALQLLPVRLQKSFRTNQTLSARIYREIYEVV
jgi:hypothetical protein